MIKNVQNWLLMAAVVLGLGTTITACRDDDDDKEKTPEQQAQETEQANEASNVFWNVVGQLAGITNYTEDYKDMTFEPTIGFADEGNALYRIVATNSLAAAVERFNDLTGAHITESTSSYEWKNDAVGTLTWTKGDSRDYATVDVSIKQMPKLQRIIYRDGDQMGTNGSFDGAAYYRFGDVVVKINKKGKEERWICVRPAFGPEKKQDSHWVCIDMLGDDNLKKKGDNWYVPTGLGTNKEHMRNLAEMIYAMLYPGQWAANLQNDEKLTVFHDFHHDKLKYHTAAYWQKVCKNWEQKNLFSIIFGYDNNNEAKNALRKAIADDGLNFLYNGYKWSWFGDKCTLFQANYSGKNLKNEKLTEKEVDMTGKTLDFRTPGQNLWNALGTFFGDDPNNVQPRWVVRHATGKELATSGYDEKKALQGCEDAYRYYNAGNTLTNLEALLQKEDPEVGDLVGRNGKFYGTGNDAKLDGTTPVGIVIYRGEEADPSWHPDTYGLALSLKDVNIRENNQKTIAWCNDTILKKRDNSWTKAVKQRSEAGPIISDWNNDMRGKNSSNSLDGIASEIKGWIDVEFNNTNSGDMSIFSSDNKVSVWYLPTASQIAYAFHSMAIHPEWANSAEYNNKYDYYTDNDNKANLNSSWYQDVLTPLFMRYGPDGASMIPQGKYWLATQMPIEGDTWYKAWLFDMSENGFKLDTDQKLNKHKLRGIVAFRP